MIAIMNYALEKLKDFQIYQFDEIDSTSDEAIRMIKNQNLFDKTMILADKQLNGRGKQGAVWLSSDGNIMMTIIYKIKKLVENFENFSIVIGQALKQIIDLYKKNDAIFDCKVKFPNDLLIDNKKVAGILPEIHFFDNQYYLIIGIFIMKNYFNFK
jgi:BirA family biotin operon repressor/biotin-[acetyl-CoA-carboxylase] ligase